ncbi:SPI-2 type III secretion system effector E3 ubiquitin transferase SspH2 [Salmonella enterica subsp. enterica serovar Bovismorbificans]|uniref:E3 ubiquitin-protein ligase SspH2 n=2 Tax=Salmonella enterica subsp. enterica serovar Bovismorbificans TaxID=58097 RepID=A0A5W4QZS7_SALET|nr:SPI-2 type III secretion system effector E3 ubiquitin transferase SspH2 [Salmonella enterica]EBM0758536.1 SPI-2 type III secretion system effector E3 ubiquitin transferase SspH2 [Salmonella enterica subsp. enterica serovar Muenchen]ECH8727880.1 SPI-2 type III secretion system effector E3 ubiquitin transferase SspH2 [Salmonella enterica subsp. enterica]EDZ9940392.1 SPI-2 type III secretion system effector E3 ubiquitin transferase SspH2 [Salmonella enterica subsp. enterica serovar Nessziona]EE
MPFHIGSGCLPATISNRRIYRIAWSDTPPEMSSWEKMKEFFCSTHQTEALECIWTICHPPAGTTREDVINRFELLRTLAYAGWEESIHSGQHGENYFCILDEDSQEILSVTLDDAGNYTVNCQGYSETHRLTLDTAQGEEGTGHAEGASGTFRTSFLPATTAPQTPAEYDAVWSAWRRAAPAEESRGRAAAVQKMRACLNNGNAVLNVGESGLTTLPDCLPAHITTLVIPDNNLTSLPALPPELRTLEVSGNQLTSLPVLPPGLLELSIFSNPLTHLPALPSGLCKLWIFGNQLTSLPVLPPGLQELSVSDNQLASLPALPSELCKLWAYNNQLTSLPTLPSGLQELSVSDNQLASLPTLPSELYKLWAYNNRLTSLPALPSGLKELIVSGNRLTSLPVLPSELKELMVSGNRLTSLPMLPSGLLSLSVYRNQLTRLPESLIHLSSETTVNLEGNPLSERTLQALREITSAPGYSGPIIRFDMAGASAPRETRALHLAAADWLVPAREGEPAPADRWHMFGQEDNADAFSLFLDRLSETENFIKDAGFKAQISSWLAQLAEDEALRANTFAMATEATSSCEDRVTFFLHQMKNVQLVHNAEKGQYDNDLAALVATGREMFRLGKLEQIAREKVRTLALVDEIEVWLAYQNKLKKSLGLTSVTAEMRFFDVSGVTVTDLQDAELQVKAAEKSEFREWILQWGPLHRVLERKAPERVNALREKQISDYEETYRMLSDTELRPSGLVGNTDAERTIGARAMESAKKTFLDGLRPLVEEMLGSYLNVQWRRN